MKTFNVKFGTQTVGTIIGSGNLYTAMNVDRIGFWVRKTCPTIGDSVRWIADSEGVDLDLVTVETVNK